VRHILIATTLAATVALPAIASAQTRCERQEADNRAAGTVIGAVGGALLGSAIAGRGDRTAGAVIGGVGGAVVGNQIAGSNGGCPDGYRVVADPAYAPPAYPYTGPAPAVATLDQQEDALARRIAAARDNGRLTRGDARDALDELQAIRDREADLRRRHGGRLTEDDRFYLQQRLDRLQGTVRLERDSGPPPPPVYRPPVDVWSGAPQGVNARMDWLQSRISDDGARGILTRAGVAEAQGGLNGLRNEAATLRTRDGGQLRDVDRQYLNDRLEYLAQRIQWMESVHR